MSEDDIPEPAAREKLLRAKEKWADEGRLLTGRTDLGHVNRLPPGQRLVTNWPVLDLGAQPAIATERWRLRVSGLVETPLILNLEQFLQLPQSEMVSDIHCVTAWSRYDNHWQGVATRTLLELVKPRPEARHVLFQSYDGYTTNVALEVFAADNALLAHHWEGQPLSREHGGPVRVVIPDWYFWKSAKWVTRIEFAAQTWYKTRVSAVVGRAFLRFVPIV